MKRFTLHLALVCTIRLLITSPSFGQGVIATVAGTDFILPSSHFGALAAPLGRVRDVCLDAAGNLYISDEQNHVVARLSPDGFLDVIAGNGLAGFSGDGGRAVNAALRAPLGVAIDRAGNLYIADQQDHRVRVVSPAGIITTLAGTGSPGFSGDGGPANRAALNTPRGLALDRAGNLYIADSGNNRIRMVSPNGTITTFGSELSTPQAVATDASGNVYVVLSLTVVRLTPDGKTQSVAGAFAPSGIAVDANGSIFISDSAQQQILRVRGSETIAIAGGGFVKGSGFSGDGGPATSALINNPGGLAVDGRGNVFFADRDNFRVRRIDTSGTITTIAGNGQYRFSGDGGPAGSANLNQPVGLGFDVSGNLLVADLSNSRIRMIRTDNSIQTVAGNGTFGFSGDGGPAVNAALNLPQGVAADQAGNFYIADQFNDRIRQVKPGGTITTLAGGGVAIGDNGPPSQAKLSFPWSVAVDAQGGVLIADSFNNRIRRVAPDGRTITTIAGVGVAGFSGDAGPATSARLSAPRAVAVDGSGRIYFSDTGNNRVRFINSAGTIQTLAGGGAALGDNGPATGATLNNPRGLAIDLAGNVYIADSFNNRVRRVAPGGTITTVAGTGTAGFSGDGDLAAMAQLNTPQGVAIDAAGNLYIADVENHRVRAVLAERPMVTATATSVAFTGEAGGDHSHPATIGIAGPFAGVPFSVAIVPSSASSWLSVTPQRGGLPVALQVVADPANLPQGVLQAVIQVAIPNANPPQLSFPVTFTVAAASNPQQLVDRQELAFHFVQKASSAVKTFTVSNSGGGPLAFKATASVISEGNWLSVSPSSGVASPGQPVSVSVTASPGTLSAGTYGGSVAISSPAVAKPVVIPVTMTVTAVPHSIVVSQVGLAFTAVAGGGVSAPQSFGILNGAQGSMSWKAQASVVSGGDWLQVSPSAGQVERPLLDVSNVEVSVNPRGLAAGAYFGKIQTTADADNSPQVVTVALTVLPQGSKPPPEVNPAGLVFSAPEGSNPGSQNLTVGNLLSNPVSYSSSPESASGNPWFSYAPLNAAVPSGSPVRVVVQPDLSKLPSGIYKGSLSFQFDDESHSVRRVDILSVIAPGPAGPSTLRPGANAVRGVTPQAAACPTPSSLEIQFRTLRQGFAAVSGQSAAVEVQVVDNCGALVGPAGQSAQVTAFFSSGESVQMTHVGAGIWQGTWRPGNVSPSVVVKVTGLVQVGGNLVGGLSTALSGSVKAQAPASLSPTTTADGVVHAASSLARVPISPGGLITIYGENLADGNGGAGSLPLPQELNGAQVLLGDQRLPILYTTTGQLNVQVPYTVPVNTQYQLTVQHGNSLSVPEQLVVAAAQPGIFTLNQQGTGQGSIVKGDQVTLARPGTPATIGETVVIYCTGLGAVSPAVKEGSPAPNTPPLSTTVNPVTVTIGDKAAQVVFAGLTPGYAGLYQVNAVVPGGITIGDAVPVVLSVAGQTSPAVTMAVR